MDLTQKSWTNIVNTMNMTIYRIYGLKDRHYYDRLVNVNNLIMPKEVMTFCRSSKIKIDIPCDSQNGDHNPSFSWQFEMPSFSATNFEAEYSTAIGISKLCKVFCIINRYSIKDQNPDTYDYYLEGEGICGAALTHLQDSLCNMVMTYLEEKGYTFLRDFVYNKIVPGIEDLSQKELFTERKEEAPPEAWYASYYDIFFQCRYDELNCFDDHYLKVRTK